MAFLSDVLKTDYLIIYYICSPDKSPPHGFARRNQFLFLKTSAI